MAVTCNPESFTFVPPLPIPITPTEPSSCPYPIQPLRRHSPHPPFCSRRRFQTLGVSHRFHAISRISNGLPAYRAALLTRRDASGTTPTIEKQPSILIKTATTAPQITEPKRAGRTPDQDSRYKVRMAEEGELYTIADIRCDAFYGYPKDPYYYPVRRREIYMAMRDRIDSGNKCLVIVDTQPPEDWLSFAHSGELVVGSLDVSLHKASSGRRCRFGSGRTETEQGGRRIYLSSMAVREEWQGRGLAQRMLAHVDVMACLYGIKEIFLHVEWENAPAVHVYQKCGFVSVENDPEVPRWLHFLAKREHTLLRKSLE